MRRSKLDFKLIIFFILVMLLGNINLISAENDKKIKDKKDKKEKEIKEKKDKIEKNTNIIDKIEDTGIISEKIHSEKVNNNIIKKNNKENLETTGYIKKETQIKNATKKFEDLQIKTNNIIRDIKQSTAGDISDIKEKFTYTKNIIKEIDNNNNEFINNLNKEERELIKKQNSIIKNSKNNLTKILSNLDKELDKKNKNIENLFNKTKELEKEIRVIYRQYRAIEWILFEK